MNRKPIPVVTFDRGTITGANALGFETVPDLVRNKSRDNGFYLNILVLGRRGLGTHTLLNSMFQAKVIDPLRPDDLSTYRSQLIENEVCLTLGIATYHKTDYSEVARYINECNGQFYQAESVHETMVADPRVHVCLYMLPNDKIFDEELLLLQRVSKICNVIPIIAKADTYTVHELEAMRAKMRNMLSQVNFFEPPQYADDAEFAKEVDELNSKFPLAVFSSDQEFEINGEVKKGRLYRWGFLDQEDPELSDLGKLRRLLICNHLDDLISATETKFYDKYRQSVLESESQSVNCNAHKLMRIRTEMEKILAERNVSIIAQIEEDIKKLEQEYNSKKSCILLNNERNNLFAKL